MKHNQRRTPQNNVSSFRSLLLAAVLLTAVGCDGDDGAQGPAGPAAPPGSGGPLSKVLQPRDDAPGVHFDVLSLSGGSGSGGNFAVGDRIQVRFRLDKTDGTPWDLSELELGRILVSGPTFNYQRVIAEQSNLLTASTENSDGSFTYVTLTIPATYLAPYNDTPSFGLDDGELQGQPLLAGTYTVGMYATWRYSVGDRNFRDQGETVAHFLFGQTSVLEPRAVVGQENCNACHSDFQFHSGRRRTVDLCVLCHTAGAEDNNNPAFAGGTPGASIAFGPMVHKIHSGGSLPSVLGVTTNPDGTRNYTATPVPYVLVGGSGTIYDYSDVTFPQWPNLSFPLPRDAGYTALAAPERALEDQMRRGAANCAACHGDPDGDGPLEAPAQAHLAYSQPTRNSCGSCHDDVVWEFPYTANTQTMPAQLTDSACTLCHASSGNGLAVVDAHMHPIENPAINPGLVFEVLALVEAGTNDGDGTLDPGEKIELTLTIEDDSGVAVSPASLTGISTTVTGPTSNYNLIQFINLPTAFLSGAQPFIFNLPESISFEFVGNATGGADQFSTSRTPHHITGFSTSAFSAALSGATTSLVEASPVRTNFLDVADATGFARNDYLVLDRGVVGLEEYLRIQFVEEDVDGTTDRLWFGSPAQSDYPLGPRVAHQAGAAVERLSVTPLTAGVEYTLDAPSGTLTETGGFVTGEAIFVSYTTDFVMPDMYELAFNDSPDLDNRAGKWSGLSLLDGTYTLMVWGNRSFNFTEFGETTAYRNTSKAAKFDFLVGDATTVVPYAAISAADNCYSCHQDIYFHGGQRRGYDTCVSCHTTAGGEDRPQYRAPGAPATTGAAIDFISMLHKIHQGENLANAASYELVGFGNTPYPNNFTPHSYGHVVFPAMPSGTKNCASCHGDTNVAWQEPLEVTHPDQTWPHQKWTQACGSCHDSNAALAHMEVMTGPFSGLESCATCHGLGKDLEVPLVHKVR